VSDDEPVEVSPDAWRLFDTKLKLTARARRQGRLEVKRVHTTPTGNQVPMYRKILSSLSFKKDRCSGCGTLLATHTYGYEETNPSPFEWMWASTKLAPWMVPLKRSAPGDPRFGPSPNRSRPRKAAEQVVRSRKRTGFSARVLCKCGALGNIAS
jgi:hypothetical protein